MIKKMDRTGMIKIILSKINKIQVKNSLKNYKIYKIRFV
jgi:hypothetical protein